MRSLTHFLRYFSRKSVEMSRTNFNSSDPSAIINSFPSSVFPSETNWEAKRGDAAEYPGEIEAGAVSLGSG